MTVRFAGGGRRSFTDRQKHLLRQAAALGYGYAIFAHNVEQQGWCSAAQEEALARMVSTGTFRKNNWGHTKYAGGARKSQQYVPDGDAGGQYAEGLMFDDF